MAHDLGGAAVGRVSGRLSGTVVCLGATAGSGKRIGVGVSGWGVAFLRVLTSSVRASLCSLKASIVMG